MDKEIVVALIGAASTIVAALIGAGVGFSEWFYRLIRKSPFPPLEGTRWESKWISVVNGVATSYSEVIEFKVQRRGRLYGCVTMPSQPGQEWEIEGDFDGHFLRLFWNVSPNAQNKFNLDHGCYFFERQPDGTFRGHSVGHDARTGKLTVDDHTVTKLP